MNQAFFGFVTITAFSKIYVIQFFKHVMFLQDWVYVEECGDKAIPVSHLKVLKETDSENGNK